MAKRLAIGYFLAEQRLAYRKHVHNRQHKYNSQKYETVCENIMVTEIDIKSLYSQMEPQEDRLFRSKLQNNYCVTLDLPNLEISDTSPSMNDTNNSAGKQIKVKEFEIVCHDKNKEKPCSNKTNSLHHIGGNDSFYEENEITSNREKCNTNDKLMKFQNDSRNDKQVNTESDQSKVYPTKRKLPSIPFSKEAELSSMINQIREAQKMLRKQIRELEDDIECKIREGTMKSKEMVEITNDIVQFKVDVLHEAQEFENFIQQTEDMNVKQCESTFDTCSQLSRIKTVTLLNDCLKDIDNFNTNLDKDLEMSTNILRDEISVVHNNLIDLTKQREDIIRQKIALLHSTDDNIDILPESVDNLNFERSGCFQDISHRDQPSKFSVLSYSYKTTVGHHTPYFHNLLSCFHGEEIENDDDKTQIRAESKALSEQKKKWERLDRQYRKHSEILRKRSEVKSNKSEKYKSPTENVKNKTPDEKLVNRFSRIKFDIPRLEKSQKIKTTMIHLKEGMRDTGHRSINNLRQLCKDMSKHSVCKPPKDNASVLKKGIKRGAEQLREWLKDNCATLSKKCEPAKTRLLDFRQQIKETFNSLSKQYTVIKWNFNRRKKSDFQNTKLSRSQIILSHIRIFLRRATLVTKFRNVLMFDREVLLPQKRYSLFEWYDLPVTVVYGIERFHQIENRFQRHLNISNNDRNDDCRFDLRIYGPMEYQLGRALTDNEMALLQEEKIAMLRNKVYKKNRKRKRKSRTHLALVELQDNSCISCLRCVKDCVFGCTKGNDSDNESSDTDENENELRKAVELNQNIAEEFMRQTRYYDPRSAHLSRRRATFGEDNLRLSDYTNEYAWPPPASQQDRESRRMTISHSPERVRFRTENALLPRSMRSSF